jgi:hypothetical protein
MPRPCAFLTGSIPRARQIVVCVGPGDLLVPVFTEEAEKTRPSEPVSNRGCHVVVGAGSEVAAPASMGDVVADPLGHRRWRTYLGRPRTP